MPQRHCLLLPLLQTGSTVPTQGCHRGQALPCQALTFLAPSSMGARHSGALLRTLLTKVDTGWKTMFSVGWMSLTASWVGTSAKSSHFLMASSPSRMAGILGDKTVRAKAQR